MKYRVKHGGREREVDVTVTPGGGAQVFLDGEPLDIQVGRADGGLVLRVGTRVYDMVVGGRADSMQVAAGAARGIVEVISDRAARKRRTGSLGGSDKVIKAPMPGRVVKILVSPGDEVEADAPCVVVEAMKMQNELRAPSAGTVDAVHVSEGQSVDGQALLISLK